MGSTAPALQGFAPFTVALRILQAKAQLRVLEGLEEGSKGVVAPVNVGDRAESPDNAEAPAAKRPRNEDAGNGAGHGDNASTHAGAAVSDETAKKPDEMGEKPQKSRAEEKQARKKKILSLNRQLKTLATRKQLREAQKLFHRHRRKGLVDVHSCTNLINAHVRCDDVEGAELVIAEMQELGFTPNVVTYTSYIKGLCGRGQVVEALETVDSMRKLRPPLVPNLRTVSTLLRGCRAAGCIDPAEQLVERMQRDWNIAPDAGCYEAVAALLAQGLRLDALGTLVTQLQAAADAAAGGTTGLECEREAALSPAIHLGHARAAAIAGRFDEANDALSRADAAIDDRGGGIAARRSGRPGFEPRTGLGSTETAGSVAGTMSAANGAASRSKIGSMLRFARHQLEEQRRELSIVRGFVLLKMRELADLDGASRAAAAARHAEWVAACFGRTLYFDPATGSPADSGPATVNRLHTALLDKFGLDSWCKMHAQPDTAGTSAQVDVARRALEDGVDSEGRLQFGTLLGESRANLPLRVEVGSGTGEWAAIQAAHDEETANWATCELKHERVYQAFAAAVLGGRANLITIGGDAVEVVGARLPLGAVDGFFVNHPEPPERTGAISEGKHLLTPDFFRLMAAALIPGVGTVTVVTDNRDYGKQLSEIAASAGFTSCLRAVDGDAFFASTDEVRFRTATTGADGGSVVLYEGTPGPQHGHAVAGSSYFDRLWLADSKVKRYYFCSRPIDANN